MTIKTYFPDIRDVLQTIVENIPHSMVGFKLDFNDIGTYENNVLFGGLGHLVLMAGTQFSAEELEWIGIKERTKLHDVKDFILAVDRLELGYSDTLFDFYQVPKEDHPTWCIRYGVKDDFALKETAPMEVKNGVQELLRILG